MAKPIHLVVGADGLVGAALFRRLRKAEVYAAATTRRRENVREDCIYLDLVEKAGGWEWPWPIQVAIICAGITKAQACKDDPNSTAITNVHGISTLIGSLVAAGAFVVFLSTNQVFDGARPCQLPGAPFAPITEYGRQKAQVEEQMAQYGNSVAIVRFSKILGPQPALIPAWVDNLRSGKPIHPFSDMTMAPIPLSCAVSVLLFAAQFRLGGIIQVSGQEDIPYSDAACIGATALGIDAQLVQPVTAAELGTYTEPVPAFTSLNVDRLREEFGLVPPDVLWTIEAAFANPQLLEGA
jgi:dTDP-4-dehydrorhamnose reductase